jgi:hypothetical protein
MLTLGFDRLITEKKPEIFYPSEDGEPLAESFVHIDAIVLLMVLLRG